MTDRDLLNIASKARDNSYSPYSRYAVGAAVECEDGRVYTGCNIENAALGCTCCAERTAIFKAISDGVRGFKRIAIYGSGEDYCVPCGACRQVMSEFCSEDMEVLCAKSTGAYASYRLVELLPHAFNLNNV